MKAQYRLLKQVLGCTLFLLLASCLQKASQTSDAKKPMAAKPAEPAATRSGELAQVDLSQKTPHELAQYIFEHNGCDSCHTLGEKGQFGYTARGQQIHEQAEGCIDLLTAMNVIAQTPQSQRTPEERTKSEHFKEYGCTSCHQITPGKMGLTPEGAKLADLHMSCPAVERLLNEPKQ